MATQNVIQSGNESQWCALVIMDAGRDPRDGMLQGRTVEVGRAPSSAEAMNVARVKFESAGPGAIGFTAERAAPCVLRVVA